MAEWVLVPCLVRLRWEFDQVAPDRDRTSDGSKGDDAHAATVSDHNPDETGRVPIRDADKVNEVHAIDVDDDLRTPGLTMEGVVQFLLGRCRSGAEKRLRYIIYRRRIWEAGNQWRQREYTGANAHDQHGHFSASYEPAREASTVSWHLEDLVALTDKDKEWLSAEIRKVVTGDADPGPRDYSLGGLITAVERRTANDDAQLEDLAKRLDRLDAAIARIETALAPVPPAGR
jgi:hypothetical protein